MENATQALLIGAGVLVGILILSLGIALMNIMGGYAANTQSEISEILIILSADTSFAASKNKTAITRMVMPFINILLFP